jgi:hypothetical protein
LEKAVELKDLDWTPPVKARGRGKRYSMPMAAMFERYVFLENMPTRSSIPLGHDVNDSMMIERAFIVSNAGKFYRYVDEEGKDKVIPLTQHWLLSDQKKVASGLKYQPGEKQVFLNGDGRAYYNVFRFPYQSTPDLPASENEDRLKMWHLIMDAVFHEHRSYVEDWLAFTIQQPEKRAGIMPVCISRPGLGKSLFMAIMARVVGYHNFSNANILDVTGLGKTGTKWGDWIHNKKISCIEEIAPEGDSSISYQVVDALKEIITNETLPLNLKGGRNGTFPIYSNIFGFSNHFNCVKIPLEDRRLYIIDSTGREQLTQKQYAELWSWINDERNIVAVFQFLMSYEISDEFIPGHAKMTRAKKALQLDGRSALQTAFDMVVEQYPCDLLTNGELQLAVSEAMVQIEGGELGDYPANAWKTDNTYKAILKNTTTLVAEGKRIRVQRLNGNRLPASRIRAIRNAQKWTGVGINDIRAEMCVDIPAKWLKDEDDEPFTLF